MEIRGREERTKKGCKTKEKERKTQITLNIIILPSSVCIEIKETNEKDIVQR